MLYHAQELIPLLESGAFDNTFRWLYPTGWEGQAARYLGELRRQQETFGASPAVALVTAPGRSEIGGNHTDHQHGCVLAAAVTMDMLAAVSPSSQRRIRILSDGYPMCTVELDKLTPKNSEKNTTMSLIRGVAAHFIRRGYQIGGFDATMSSQVPKGSGLSSSAAFEVMIGTILNRLYNNGAVTPVEIAQIGQLAENEFFGKPSGLMDQTASSVGGFVAIDFADPTQPVVRQVDCDLTALGYTLCVVNAGGSHANLTPEYAAIPAEMGLVAAAFGKAVLREVSPAEFFASLGSLRGKVPDRALLRAIHFFDENTRAQEQAAALERRDMEGFLALVRQSGESSQEQLQNIFPANGSERSVSLALALSHRLLGGAGASRVHGGGFAGTIQAFVPSQMVHAYRTGMEQVFGADCCYPLSVRPVGGYLLTQKEGL